MEDFYGEKPVSYDPPPEYADHLLASLESVAATVGGTVITQDDVNLAYQMILMASLEAVRIGSAGWTRNNVPIGVSAIVTQAAARGFMNPRGVNYEANADVRYGLGDQYVQGAELTPAERRQIKSMAGRAGFVAIPLSNPTHWQSRADKRTESDTWYVPWTEQLGRKEFPFGGPDEFKGA